MGKAKDGSECFTRTGKGGGKYVTCKGTQKGGAKQKADSARKELRKKVPEKKPVTKAQFEGARKKLAGGSASGKSKKPAPKKKLGVKITPKPKNTIGGRPAGKRVDTGGARNVGKVDKSKPPPKKKTAPKKKKDVRKPPPKLKGLNWKLTEEKVNDKANYWTWKARGADSIENVGETTTYDYDFDSLATDENYFEPEETRKGMVFDDEGNEYPIAEFKRKYNALQRKLSKK